MLVCFRSLSRDSFWSPERDMAQKCEPGSNNRNKKSPTIHQESTTSKAEISSNKGDRAAQRPPEPYVQDEKQESGKEQSGNRKEARKEGGKEGSRKGRKDGWRKDMDRCLRLFPGFL